MKRLALSVLAAILVGACQSDTTPDGTTTLVPTTSSTLASTSTTRSTPTTYTTTTLPATGTETAVYLFFEGYPVAPGPYLVAVARPGDLDLGEALTALLDGATEDEATMGLSSTIPTGTELLAVDVSDGMASVDLSSRFETGGGSLSMMGRVAQIVYTATRFDEVDSVRFLLEGAPLDVLGGEGLMIDRPQTRSDWTDLIPPIMVEAPPWGSTVGIEVAVDGTADLESGTVSYVIVDAEGLIIHEGEISSTPGERSEFGDDVTLEEIPNAGVGSIIVWEWASDGSQQHVLEYPLTLTTQS